MDERSIVSFAHSVSQVYNHQSDLRGAVSIMVGGLGDIARTLMQTPLPGGGGNFGPDFRLVA